MLLTLDITYQNFKIYFITHTWNEHQMKLTLWWAINSQEKSKDHNKLMGSHDNNNVIFAVLEGRIETGVAISRFSCFIFTDHTMMDCPSEGVLKSGHCLQD